MKKLYITFLTMLLCSGDILKSAQSLLNQELNLINLDSRVDVLQKKLKEYENQDDHLKALDDQFSIYKKNIDQYNHFLSENKLQPLFSDQTFQNDLKMEDLFLNEVEENSSIIMQGKNLDWSWQFQKYGIFKGTFYFIKNMFIPNSMKSCTQAGVGALTAVALSRQNKSSTTIINIPQGASNITIKSDNDNLVRTLGICTLGAGITVAGIQWYHSFMYDRDSKNKMSNIIEKLKNKNRSLSNTFALSAIESNIQAVDSRLMSTAAASQCRDEESFSKQDFRNS